MSAFGGSSIRRKAGAAFVCTRSHVRAEEHPPAGTLLIPKNPTRCIGFPRVLAASPWTTTAETHHIDALKVAPVMWMLLDCGGRIVRTGEETMPHIHLRRILEARFPGICTSETVIVPWRDLYGRPIRDSRQRIITIACVFLAPGSPLPGERPELHQPQIIRTNNQGIERC